MTIKFAICAILMLGASVGSASADERYYMMIFGSQTEPFAFSGTHTFALFVKATGDGNDFKEYKLETQTISWMPKTLEVRVIALRPETGVNLTIQESIRLAISTNARTTMWGPFDVKKDFYDMAAVQAARLNRNAVEYKAADSRFRGPATNCIHAVSDLDSSQPALETGIQAGHAASEAVVKHFGRHIQPSKESNRWLCVRLRILAKEVVFATLEPIR